MYFSPCLCTSRTRQSLTGWYHTLLTSCVMTLPWFVPPRSGHYCKWSAPSYNSYYNELTIYELSLVNVIAPANASIFPEYIIPNIHPLVQDPEVSVRSLYAQCIVPLADAAVRYLEMGQALKAHGTFKVSTDAVEYDEAQFEVSSFIVRFLGVLITIRFHTTRPCKTCRTLFKSIL